MLLYAMRLTAVALHWPSRRSATSASRRTRRRARGCSLGGILALGVLLWLVLRNGEETVWLAGDGGGVLAPAAAMAAAPSRPPRSRRRRARARRSVRERRGELVATLSRPTCGPTPTRARVAVELEPRLRGRLAAVTGVAPGAVTVRPHVLGARQLKRHLP